MTQSFRRDGYGHLNRNVPLTFSWNGKKLQGYEGDTLASALLANGVHLVGRSFKYHRPRGLFAAGHEDPNGLAQLESGGFSEPNVRMSRLELYDGLSASAQNCWPGLSFDVGAVNDVLSAFFPAGFYYKTFMWPKKAWMFYEGFIRRAAGLGKSPEAPDAERYDRNHAHCELLIVGSGPAGLAAALNAGRSGKRIILLEDDAELGGSLLSEGPNSTLALDGLKPMEWRDNVVAKLQNMPNVRILTRTLVYSALHDNAVHAIQRHTDHLPLHDRPQGGIRQTNWMIRAGRVLLATGAIERPIVFNGNDRPGILLASAARTWLNRYGVLPGKRIALFGNNDSIYRLAEDMRAAGCEIAAVLDSRFETNASLEPSQAYPIHTGVSITETKGRLHIKELSFRARTKTPHARSPFGTEGPIHRVGCDCLLVSGGWSPTLHLFSQSRGQIVYDPNQGMYVPGKSFEDMICLGACGGMFDLSHILSAQNLEGPDRRLVLDKRNKSKGVEVSGHFPGDIAEPLWLAPSDRELGKMSAFVDFQNDSTAKDLALAVREGFRSVEHVKRYTTTGMATDQGKTSNVNALGITSGLLEDEISRIGTTTFRPPYVPVTFGALAADNPHALGEARAAMLFDPIRTTPIHKSHINLGAMFEPVGQWQRAWYYPQVMANGKVESMEEAVNREVLAARQNVGLMDSSTLGKIDVQGADAAEFMNRIYTNAWKKLPIGGIRYGLMLNDEGMVMDDGVAYRLAEDHFVISTTTGGAAGVMAGLEDLLQTEWPLNVYLTSVTEQYASVTLSGPRARDTLAKLVNDVDISPREFPHMTFKIGDVAGVPVRILRVSFTGEVSYEINVPSSYGRHLWDAAMEAGQEFGITPYGTEAMHVLRAEKGYIIVGQETDGSVTAEDLGMTWAIAKKKGDFIGKRGSERSYLKSTPRKQLVGLEIIHNSQTKHAKNIAPIMEGAQLYIEHPHVSNTQTKKHRVPLGLSCGHVTSSYLSPNCNCPIALALLEDGQARMGQEIWSADINGRVVQARVTGTVFFDPKNERLHQ